MLEDENPDLETKITRRRPVPPNSVVKRWSLPSEVSENALPPVCSVHPGRTLELTTTIGIAKLKNVLQESMDSPPLHYGSTFIQQRSRLKSGRLQPLGLHTDPYLSSQTCLGVVSESRRRYQRSLTAPTLRPESRHGPQGWNSKWTKIPVHRRVFSANPNTSFEFESSGIIMMRNHSLPSHKPQPLSMTLQQSDEPRGPGRVQLPAVTSPGSKALNIHIEIKGTKPISDNPISSEMNKLPDLSTMQPNVQPNEDALEMPLNEELSVNVVNLDSSHSTNSVYYKRKRRPSGNTGGKLSHGWTSPQPLIPLRGEFPPITDTKRLRDIKKEIEPVNSSDDKTVDADINEIEPVISSDDKTHNTVDVDINEILNVLNT